MKPLLNLDEPVQRRTGEPAEIIKRNALGSFPVVALLTNKLGTAQFSQSFTLRGSVSADYIDNDGDLINVPRKVHKIHYWVAINTYGHRVTFDRQPAPHWGNFLAVKEINYEVTEGEGLP